MYYNNFKVLHMREKLNSGLFVIRCNGLETIRKGPKSAWGMPYFFRMFKDDIIAYVRKLIVQTKPEVVAVCMIYFPSGANALQISRQGRHHCLLFNNPIYCLHCFRVIFRETRELGR